MTARKSARTRKPKTWAEAGQEERSYVINWMRVDGEMFRPNSGPWHDPKGIARIRHAFRLAIAELRRAGKRRKR